MVFAQSTTYSASSGSPALSLIYLVVFVFFAAVFWRIFTKAGEPGWAGIIPIYNLLVLLKIVGRPWWWIFLLVIPFVNLITLIIVYVDLAKSFGKGGGFAVGLILLSVIFFPILAWGSSTYVGPAAART